MGSEWVFRRGGASRLRNGKTHFDPIFREAQPRQRFAAGSEGRADGADGPIFRAPLTRGGHVGTLDLDACAVGLVPAADSLPD